MRDSGLSLEAKSSGCAPHINLSSLWAEILGSSIDLGLKVTPCRILVKMTFSRKEMEAQRLKNHSQLITHLSESITWTQTLLPSTLGPLWWEYPLPPNYIWWLSFHLDHMATPYVLNNWSSIWIRAFKPNRSKVKSRSSASSYTTLVEIIQIIPWCHVKLDEAQVQYNHFCAFSLQAAASVLEFAKVSILLGHLQTVVPGDYVPLSPFLASVFLSVE